MNKVEEEEEEDLFCLVNHISN